jgi:hypothetical protein
MTLRPTSTVALAHAGGPLSFDAASKRDPRLRGDDGTVCAEGARVLPVGAVICGEVTA